MEEYGFALSIILLLEKVLNSLDYNMLKRWYCVFKMPETLDKELTVLKVI